MTASCNDYRLKPVHMGDTGGFPLAIPISARWLVTLAVALAAALLATRSAVAQTWTGAVGTDWNSTANWSPVAFPASNPSTSLTFGAATNYSTNQNLVNPFNLNSMTFTSAATSAYTIQGFPLAFFQNGAGAPSIISNSTHDVTFTDGVSLVLGGFSVGGLGTGTLSLNGAISGPFGITKTGTDTVVLGGANTFLGGLTVNGGVLSITNPSAIFAATPVTVAAGAEFRIGYISGSNSSAPIGTVTLNGGTLRVPAGVADTFLNKLSVSNGGSVNFAGATDFFLHLVGTGAGIDVTGNSTWTGGGTSQILNSSAATIDLNIPSGSTLTNGIILAQSNGQGFRLTGGGALVQTASGSSASILVDGFSSYRFANANFATSGPITLQAASVLNYTGASASTLNSLIALGSGGGQIVMTGGGALTLSSAISETGGSQPLFVVAGTAVLTGANTYTGKSDAYASGVISVGSIPNGGIASPLGKSTSAPSNLVIEDGTLRYTGPTASTDRGMTLSNASSKVEVTAAANSLTIGGQITGSGALNKIGAGTLVLSNTTNNYIGTTFVNAGTLQLTGSSNEIPVGGNVTVASGATFAISSGSNGVRTPGTITLNGGTMSVAPYGSDSGYTATNLVMTGGALNIPQGNGAIATYNFDLLSQITINASSITSTWNGSTTPGAAIQASNIGSLIINVVKGTTPSGIDLDSSLSLHGSFTKMGSGVMRMSQQGYTDTNLTVAQGTFRFDNVSVFNNFTSIPVFNSTMTLAGGTLQYGGTTSANAGANPLALGSGGATIDVANAGVALGLPGVVSGSVGLTKTGAGTLTLSNSANTYSGPTTISGGVLSVPVIVNGGANSSIGRSSSASSNLVLAGGTLQFTGSALNSDRGFTVSAPSTFDAAGSLFVSFSGPVVGSGKLTKTGSQDLGLFANNPAFSGGVDVQGGNLQAGNLGTTGDLGTGKINIGASGTVTFLRSDTSITVPNSVSGTGTLAFGAPNTINQGTFQLTADNSNFHGRISLLSARNSRLSVTDPSQIGTAAVTVNSGSSLSLNAFGTYSNALTLSGNGWTESSGQLGALRLDNSATGSGPITLAANSRITTTNSVLTVKETISGVISGNFGLEKTGDGTLILSGVNTYTGATTISAGTLAIGNLADGGASSNIGASSNASANLVLNGGTLRYTSGSVTTDRGFTVSAPSTIDLSFFAEGVLSKATFKGSVAGAGQLNKTGQEALVLSGNNSSFTGGFNVSLGLLQAGAGGGSGDLGSGNVSITANGAVSFFRTDNVVTILNKFSGSGPLQFIGNDATDQSGYVLKGDNRNYSGAITVGDEGATTKAARLGADNFNQLGTATVTVQPGSSLYLSDSAYANPLTLSGNGWTESAGQLGALRLDGGAIVSGPVTLAADTRVTTHFGVDSGTIAGPISGGFGLEKTGAGKLVLSNFTNSYTGTTIVSAGTLKLGTASADQIPAGGNVTVASGATLDLGSPAHFGNLSRAAGTITLNGGTMTAGPLSAFGTYDASALVMTGGTVDFSPTAGNQFELRLRTNVVTINASNTTAVWKGDTAGNTALTNDSGNPMTITVAKGSTPSGIDLDSGLSLASSFVKAGPGVMRMTRQVFGLTKLTVAAGTLRLDDVGVFNNLTEVSTFQNSLTLAGGTFQYGGPTATADANPLTLGTGGATIDLPTAGVALTLPGVVGGTVGLAKTGPGTLTLSNSASTYAGSTIIAGGTLEAATISNGGVASSIGSSSSLPASLFVGNATLRYTGATTSTDRGMILLDANSRMDVANAGTNLAFGGQVQGVGGLTKIGPGTLTLSGANTYAGVTTISNGVLSVATMADGGAPSGIGSSSNQSSNLVLAGGTLQYTGSAHVTTNRGLTVSAPSTIDIAGQGLTFSGPIVGSAKLTKTGIQTLQFTANNPGFSGGIDVQRLFVEAGSGGSTGDLGTGNVNIASGASVDWFRSNNAVTISNVVTGAGGLDFSGTGVINQSGYLLTGNNSNFSGAIGLGSQAAPDAVRLEVTNPNQVGSGLIVVQPTSSLFLSGGATYANTLRIRGNGWVETAGQLGALRLDNGVTVSGPVTLFANSRVTTFLAQDTGTISSVISGGFALEKTGDGTLIINGLAQNTFTGDTHVSAGTLALGKTGGITAVPGTLTIDGPGTVQLLTSNQIADTSNVTLRATAGTATFDTNGQSEIVAQLSGVGTITGGGTLITGAVAGPSTAGSGGITVNAATTLVTTSLLQDRLTVNGTINIKRLSTGGNTSVVHALTIAGTTGAWTGKLDLADNRMIIDYTGSSPLATVTDQIKSGRAGGTWTGNGIRSSLANAANFAIGYGEASTVLGLSGNQTGTFGGQSVDATSVLVRFTINGDANLDGSVGFADLVAVAQHYGISDGSANWSTGDFNFDGNVGFADLVAVAQNYGGALASAAIPSAPADFAGDMAQAFGSVPEPGSLSIVALAGLVLRRGRRRD